MALSDKEKQLKSILSEEHFEIDTELIWQGVQGRVPRQKSKKRGFFWIIGGASSVVVLTLAIWSLSYSDKGEAVQETSSTVVIDHTNDTDKAIPTIDINKVATTAQNEEAETKDKINFAETSQSKFSTYTTEKNVPTEQTFTPSLKTSTLDNESITRTALSDNPVRDKVLKQTSRANLSNGITTPEHPSSSLMNKSVALTAMPTLSLIKSADLAVANKIPNLHHSIRPVHHKKYLPIFFHVSTGGNFSFGNWSAKNGEPTQSFSSERAVAGLSGNLSIGYSFHDNWDLILGISMTQSVYRYQNNSSGSLISTENGTVEYIIDEQGTQQAVTGSLATETLVNQELHWHRKHQYLDANLSIRYRLALSKSIYSSLQAGMFYTLSQRHCGYYRDDTTVSGIQKFEGKQDSPYEAQPLGFTTGIGLHKKLGKIDFGLRLGLRYSPNNQLEKSALYTLKNSQTDLQLGITYRPEWD